MRRAFAILLIGLLFIPNLPARTAHGWNNVKKLRHGARVMILLWNGDRLSGRIDSVGDAGLRLATPDHVNPQASWIRTVDRASIRRIVRVPNARNLPDPGKSVEIGAIAGGAAGVVTVAISDAKHGNQGRWLVGGLLGAVGGAMAGLVTAGIIGIAETAPALVHHGTLVYQDSSSGPLAVLPQPQP